MGSKTLPRPWIPKNYKPTVLLNQSIVDPLNTNTRLLLLITMEVRTEYQSIALQYIHIKIKSNTCIKGRRQIENVE